MKCGDDRSCGRIALVDFARTKIWCSFFVLTTLLASCDKPAEEPALKDRATTSVPGRIPSLAFQEMAPDSGDVLVPPRIGLRWSYWSPAANPDTLAPAEGAVELRFRVQVVDSAGIPYVDTQTTQHELQVTLPPRSPSGTYSWWVERLDGADSTLEVSAVQKFELR